MSVAVVKVATATPEAPATKLAGVTSAAEIAPDWTDPTQAKNVIRRKRLFILVLII
jgi:hypothetical protein